MIEITQKSSISLTQSPCTNYCQIIELCCIGSISRGELELVFLLIGAERTVRFVRRYRKGICQSYENLRKRKRGEERKDKKQEGNDAKKSYV